MTTKLTIFRNLNLWHYYPIAVFCLIALLTSCSNKNNSSVKEVGTWDKDLKAIVLLVVEKNGNIKKMVFVKRSGNEHYDEFVARTIREANPLPPFPPEMKRETYELALRFTAQNSNKERIKEGRVK